MTCVLISSGIVSSCSSCDRVGGGGRGVEMGVGVGVWLGLEFELGLGFELGFELGLGLGSPQAPSGGARHS